MSDMKAVRFDRYGDIDVLEIRTVPRPSAAAGRVLVQVKAAGINPGEAMIRKGLLHDRYPATFPSGQGSDLAGIVAEVGEGVAGFQPGDEVCGFSHERASHADYVSVPAEQLMIKPKGVSFEVAGGLFVAGTTAYAAIRAVGLAAGETIVVAGAAGGVGTIAVQLAKQIGATVLGIAGPANDAWLAAHGVIPVNYGDNLKARLLAAAPHGRIDAFLDLFGGGYVELAVAGLKVAPERVNSIIDFAAVEQFKAQSVGSASAANIQVLAELAGFIETGQLEVPIAKVYPLGEVQSAFRELEGRHTRGKIVLQPSLPPVTTDQS
jgi:NADPH:quinone reductase-like Zn-dependent oxidoreductase